LHYLFFVEGIQFPAVKNFLKLINNITGKQQEFLLIVNGVFFANIIMQIKKRGTKWKI